LSESSAPTGIDLGHMAAALMLARRALGQAWPNPAVGCVVLDPAGRVVGRGFTKPGGRPHAESEALAQAGEQARGGTAYVTLEPCAHHGQTPPCAEALIAAGIARVVSGVEDPDPRVSGRGLDLLRKAGLAVVSGVCKEEAEEINFGFFTRLRHGRPMVTLKLATSLDGRIALASGESRWITDEAARRRGHWLRATHDAVLIGAGTALSDDPQLTCRLPGLEHRSPVRVLIDPNLRVPPTAKLYREARAVALWVIAAPSAAETELTARRAVGAETLKLPAGPDGRPVASAILSALGARGITRLLVEGGSRMATALLEAGLVDRIAWFRAPVLIGADGLPATALLGLDRLSAAPRFHLAGVERLGPDLLESYERDD
jgi:diaminohydroxyphosphoribosylaminopyrimidine deaminase/5-amino-6-(5-phosphoribosylamino)uracil reductase